MKEFMLLVRNIGTHQATWAPERHQEFLHRCEMYIGDLKKKGQLIAAQPLVRDGAVISGARGDWKEVRLDTTRDVQVGYYHILAVDLNQAIAVAKENPEFAFGATASIEVRPVKTNEESTGFTYPDHTAPR